MAKKKKKSNTNEDPNHSYFISLEVENIRCFTTKQIINFTGKDNVIRPWTIILGDNGTGKTTLLQLLYNYFAFVLLTSENKNNQDLSNNLESIKNQYKDLNNLGKKELENLREIYTKLENKFDERILFLDTIKINSERFGFGKSLGGNVVLSSTKISRNCFGYGASRKIGKTLITDDSDFAYKTLFDETSFLLNPEEWILQADYAASRDSEFKEKRKQKYEKVKEILIRILPDVDGIQIIEKESDNLQFPSVEFHTPYGWVEAKDLSLGYRTSMAWMVDFASRMFDLYPESENPLAEPAVVLIDEIDLHLHPKWQRDLLPWLSELFPNTQFIVTTHSPLIVQSAVARDANIVVCRREGDHVVIDQSVEAVKNWRADQILTSDLFGLETARPKETGNLLKEKQKILSKAKLTKKDEKRLAELDQEIGFLPVSENPDDDDAMEIIRKAADWIKTQAK